MAFTSNRLSVVGSDVTETTPYSESMSSLMERWHRLDARIGKINALHDESLESASLASSQSDDLLGVLLEAEEEQRQLLLAISMTPAENRHDVIAKLEVWRSVAMPGGGEVGAADPMDLMVNSVLTDLEDWASNSR